MTSAFSKSSVVIDRFHRIRVDGSRIRKEKDCVFKSKRILVDRALHEILSCFTVHLFFLQPRFPDESKKLLEVCFEFPFNLIGESLMAYSTCQ